jgi:hypothetical protein
MPKLGELRKGVSNDPVLDTNLPQEGPEPTSLSLVYTGYANLQGPPECLGLDVNSYCTSEGGVRQFILRHRNGNGTVAQIRVVAEVVAVVGEQVPYNPPRESVELKAGGSRRTKAKG